MDWCNWRAGKNVLVNGYGLEAFGGGLCIYPFTRSQLVRSNSTSYGQMAAQYGVGEAGG